MKLSVIIPAYNEINTLDSILKKVIRSLPEVDKEIVIVDDGSTDGTREWIAKTFNYPDFGIVKVGLNPDSQLVIESETLLASQPPLVTVRVIFHAHNQGKGAALNTGFQAATGDVLVIQDADLEYNPQDWGKMWDLIIQGWADVVYGSRFYGEPHRVLNFHHFLGNKVISNFISILYNHNLTDVEVCYKMFKKEVLNDIKLRCQDFGFEVEFTIKMLKSPRRWRIYETGIAYYGRDYSEGKKINWKDGIKALWYIIRFGVKD